MFSQQAYIMDSAKSILWAGILIKKVVFNKCLQSRPTLWTVQSLNVFVQREFMNSFIYDLGISNLL